MSKRPGLVGTELAKVQRINAERQVMLRLQNGEASVWEMTKMAFKLGLGEATVAKSVTNDQAQATRQAVNRTVATNVDK